MKTMKILSPMLVAIIAILISSCKQAQWIQMSEQAMKKYNLTDDTVKLKKLQYRTVELIQLEKTSKKKKDTIEDGVLTFRLDSSKHTEIIKPRTFGRMLLAGGVVGELFIITVSGDSLNLVYGPDSKGNYVLYAMDEKNKEDEDIEYIFSENQTVNKIIYGNDFHPYSVIQGITNGSSKLEFSTKGLKSFTQTRHRADGAKVNK